MTAPVHTQSRLTRSDSELTSHDCFLPSSSISFGQKGIILAAVFANRTITGVTSGWTLQHTVYDTYYGYVALHLYTKDTAFEGGEENSTVSFTVDTATQMEFISLVFPSSADFENIVIGGDLIQEAGTNPGAGAITTIYDNSVVYAPWACGFYFLASNPVSGSWTQVQNSADFRLTLATAYREQASAGTTGTVTYTGNNVDPEDLVGFQFALGENADSSADQTLPSFTQLASSIISDTGTVTQELPGLSQMLSALAIVTGTSSQTLSGFSQAAVGNAYQKKPRRYVIAVDV